MAISRICLLHFFDYLPEERRLYVLVSNVMTSIRRGKIGYKNSATRCPFDRAGGERSKAIWAIWPLHAFQKGASLRRGTLSGCKRIVAGLLMAGTSQLCLVFVFVFAFVLVFVFVFIKVQSGCKRIVAGLLIVGTPQLH